MKKKVANINDKLNRRDAIEKKTLLLRVYTEEMFSFHVEYKQ